MRKRFTDREVGLILQRALEPEADMADVGLYETGLSLDQIKEVALEAGIDPGRIELAAAGLNEPHPPPPNPFAGIPTTVQFETELPGIDLASLDRQELLDTIRSALGRHGIVGDEEDAITWRARDVSGGRYVTLSRNGGGVRLRVLGNFRDGLMTVFAAGGTVVFGLASVVLESFGLGPASALTLSALAGFLSARLAYRLWRRGEDRRMAALHGRLLAALRRRQDSQSPPRLPSTATVPTREELP